MRLNIVTAVVTGLANAAIANHATLLNTSSGHHPLNIVYQMAYQNPGEPVVLGSPQKIQLNKEMTIQFSMNGYQLAGMVPVSIDGHVLPASANEFDNPQRCSLTTDHKHDSGTLAITYEALPDGHGKLTCAVRGGIFG